MSAKQVISGLLGNSVFALLIIEVSVGKNIKVYHFQRKHNLFFSFSAFLCFLILTQVAQLLLCTYISQKTLFKCNNSYYLFSSLNSKMRLNRNFMNDYLLSFSPQRLTLSLILLSLKLKVVKLVTQTVLNLNLKFKIC